MSRNRKMDKQGLVEVQCQRENVYSPMLITMLPGLTEPPITQ